jgi:3,4-dihydroxy-2-butanone 4-phosphate synthase
MPGKDTQLDEVERAVKDIAEGRPVVVVDDEGRENEGDIIFAASAATPELLAFMIRYTSGVICVPLPGQELDRLQLPLMTTQNTEHMRTAFTVSVDARQGTTTGISAADRATTIKTLTDPQTTAADLVRPGHIFPLRYAEGGVLRRPGHTEAAVDLARLAGLPEAGVLAEVVNDDGTMARLRGRARPGADLHRAAHRVPPPHRTAADQAGPHPDPQPARALAGLRLPARYRRYRVHGVDPRRRASARRGADQAAFRVPDG